MTKKEKRAIELQYAELMHDIKTNEYYNIDLTNRTNTYTCPGGHITKTRDIDAGVTPFMHSCGTCGEIATSSFYRDTHPNLEPTEEWYRPTLEEVFKLSEGLREHVLQGGLNVRKIVNEKI
jgi:hypothetical protein